VCVCVCVCDSWWNCEEDVCVMCGGEFVEIGENVCVCVYVCGCVCCGFAFRSVQEVWSCLCMTMFGTQCGCQLETQLIRVKQTPWDATDTLSRPPDATCTSTSVGDKSPATESNV